MSLSYARARSPPCSAWARPCTHTRGRADVMLLPRRGECARPTAHRKTEASQRTHSARTIITCRRTSAVFIINVVYYTYTAMYARTPRTLFGVCSHTKREITSSDKTHVDPQGSRSGFTPYRLPPCKTREYPVAFKKFLSLSLSLSPHDIHTHYNNV